MVTKSTASFIKMVLWITWFELKLSIKHHMSLILASVLAIWTVSIEWHELIRWHLTPKLSVLLLVIVTILAAVQEIWKSKEEIKLSVEQQAFVLSMDLLLNELEKLSYGKDNETDIAKRLESFSKDTIQIACLALSKKHRIEASVLISADSNNLRVFESSKGLAFLNEALFPFSSSVENTQRSLASYAYERAKIAYMPDWKWNLAYLFTMGGSPEPMYELEPIDEGSAYLLPETTSEAKGFRSMLCVPITTYEKKGARHLFGVLLFASKTPDFFLNIHISMARTFASILGQAFSRAYEGLLLVNQDKN